MFEKVNPSHPDKIADRIGGAVVDLGYKKQNNPKIAGECLIGHGNCHIILETSVSYEEKECVRGAEAAVSCGCDYLMGTMYFDSVSQICAQNNIKYMPFAGEVYGRPSILGGSVESIIAQAKELSSKGVYGFDLLGYRFTGNASLLNERFVSQIDLPVCIAGSINSFERLDEIKAVSPWAFTVGSAFFENKFGADIAEQIDCVCDYIKS